jgi:transcriptional regulator with XRE-family HTH domain
MSKASNKYEGQRPRLVPPRAGVGAIRNAKGMTLEQVCDRMTEQLGRTYTRGALSAIENGHRGASRAVLAALEVALDLRAGDLVTDYEPTTNTRRKDPAA